MRVTKSETELLDASITGWAASTTTYDAHGQALSMVGANGLSQSQTYAAPFFVTVASATDAMGRVTTTTADPRTNLPLTVTTPDGLTSETTYDVLYRATQVVARQGSTTLRKVTTSYTTYAPGDEKLQTPQTPNSVTSCAHYGSGLTQTLCSTTYTDGLGRTYKVQSPGPSGPRYLHTAFDSAGRAYRTSLPTTNATAGQAWTTQSYDATGAVTSMLAPDGAVTEYLYHDPTVALPAGAITTGAIKVYRDATHWVMKRTFTDEKGQVRKLTQGITATEAGVSLTYSYDVKGQLIAVTAPAAGGQSATTTMTYNSSGQQLSVVDPNAGTTTLTYHTTPGQPTFGQLATQVRPAPNGATGAVTKTMTYDSYGRSRTVTETSTLTYDETDVTYGVGKLTTASTTTDGVTTTTRFGYDIFGDAVTTFNSVTGPDVTFTATYTQTKDELGRNKTVTYPGGEVLETVYDAIGNVSHVKLDGQTYATYSNYNLMGQMGTMVYGNGIQTAYTYDPLNARLTQLQATQESTTLQSYGYTFDQVGALTALSDGVQPAVSATYSYDALNRLTQVTRQSGQTITFAFDDAGNVTRKDSLDDQGQLVTKTLTYMPGGHRVQSDGSNTYSFSASGNILSKGVVASYAYTSSNMLKQVSMGGVVKVDNVYGHGESRVLKRYYKDAQTTYKTYYLGDGYEIREKWVNGALSASQATKYILGAGGHKVASITTGQSLAAYNAQSADHTHRVLAALYRSDTLSGLVRKGYHAAALVGFNQTVGVIVLSVLALLCLAGVYYGQRVRQRLRQSAVIWGVLAVLLAHCHGQEALPLPMSSQLEAILQSDTSMGLPLGTFYYHHNHLGSSALVTDTAGAVVTRIEYQPYGEIDQQYSVGTDQVTHKFTGQEYDVEANLHNYGARFYDQTIGLFVSADTVIPSAADAQSYNRYMYVRGNAIQYTDPTGHIPISPTGQIPPSGGGGGATPPPPPPPDMPGGTFGATSGGYTNSSGTSVASYIYTFEIGDKSVTVPYFVISSPYHGTIIVVNSGDNVPDILENYRDHAMALPNNYMVVFGHGNEGGIPVRNYIPGEPIPGIPGSEFLTGTVDLTYIPYKNLAEIIAHHREDETQLRIVSCGTGRNSSTEPLVQDWRDDGRLDGWKAPLVGNPGDSLPTLDNTYAFNVFEFYVGAINNNSFLSLEVYPLDQTLIGEEVGSMSTGPGPLGVQIPGASSLVATVKSTMERGAMPNQPKLTYWYSDSTQTFSSNLAIDGTVTFFDEFPIAASLRR